MVTAVDNMQKDFRGKSTDSKPQHVANGATFYEIDTQTLYMFDAESGDWVNQDGEEG